MALKPLRPCRHTGCHELTRDGYCEKHRREKQQRYDRQRGSSTKRGYGGRWQRYRKRFLAENPLCVKCRENNGIEPSTDVDHIVAVSGPDDPLFWDPDNHQALCHSCHSAKTAKEDGGFGR